MKAKESLLRDLKSVEPGTIESSASSVRYDRAEVECYKRLLEEKDKALVSVIACREVVEK